MNQQPNRRSLANIFVLPASQTRLAIAFMALLLIHCGVFVIQFTQAHAAFAAENETVQNSCTGVDFAHQMLSSFWFTGTIGLMIYGVTAVFLWLLNSHRIFGPVVAIRRHIRALSAGDYDVMTNLRPKDELCEVADELNALSLILKEARAKAQIAEGEKR